MIVSDDLILKFQADFMKKFCRIDEKIRKGLQEFVQLNRKNECKKSLWLFAQKHLHNRENAVLWEEKVKERKRNNTKWKNEIKEKTNKNMEVVHNAQERFGNSV